MSATLLLDSSQSDKDSANFSVRYIPPIELDREKLYEIGFISCTCWHAIANVKTGVNDEFTIVSTDPHSPIHFKWISIKIPQRPTT